MVNKYNVYLQRGSPNKKKKSLFLWKRLNFYNMANQD